MTSYLFYLLPLLTSLSICQLVSIIPHSFFSLSLASLTLSSFASLWVMPFVCHVHCLLISLHFVYAYQDVSAVAFFYFLFADVFISAYQYVSASCLSCSLNHCFLTSLKGVSAALFFNQLSADLKSVFLICQIVSVAFSSFHLLSADLALNLSLQHVSPYLSCLLSAYVSLLFLLAFICPLYICFSMW